MAILFQSLAASVPDSCRQGVLTIGNFDGVHLGHQTLLAETIRQARAIEAPAVAVTFDPHPQQLLRPEAFQPVLTTVRGRADLLEGQGVDHVVVFRITPAFLQLSARDFFDRILRDLLRARGIVEGFNFGFGRKREGTTDTLKSLGQSAGMSVSLVAALEVDGKPVSTSRVRDDLLSGNIALARRLLGRPYRLEGTVTPGQKRGQTLGFPTANLADIATLVPGDGVYAARAFHNGAAYSAAVNIGPNPTFSEQARKVEAHLIGFTGDLYGQSLTLDFLERIRDTKRFSGPAELREQLQRDVEQVKEAQEGGM